MSLLKNHYAGVLASTTTGFATKTLTRRQAMAMAYPATMLLDILVLETMACLLKMPAGFQKRPIILKTTSAQILTIATQAMR